MPHRDDREAAHQRIEALERELEEARERAERAEVALEATKVRLDGPERTAPTPSKGKKQKQKQPPKRRASNGAPIEQRGETTPSWPPGGAQRFRSRVTMMVGVIFGPLLLALVCGALSLDSERRAIAIFGAPVLAQLFGTYTIGRASGAPFPVSATLVTMLASPLVLMSVLAAGSDLLWSDVFAHGALRWLVRGLLGGAAVVVGALVSAAWATEAAASDVGTD